MKNKLECLPDCLLIVSKDGVNPNGAPNIELSRKFFPGRNISADFVPNVSDGEKKSFIVFNNLISSSMRPLQISLSVCQAFLASLTHMGAN